MQVNVLYTVIPPNLRGGELEVWPWESDSTELNKVIVFPEENAMVEFRGDACHRVRGFRSGNGLPRISLVVEQYRVPTDLYKYTNVYCFGHECSGSGASNY